MKNGIENGYYHEITPQGFGLAIKAKEVLFSIADAKVRIIFGSCKFFDNFLTFYRSFSF